MSDWLRRKIAPWRGTLENILAGLVFAITAAAVVASVFAGMCIGYSTIYMGTRVEYEGTVQAVTRSDFWAPHTDVVMRTYSEDDVQFTLAGYHDFDIGTQYKISMVMRSYVYGLVCWGDVPTGGITSVESRGG